MQNIGQLAATAAADQPEEARMAALRSLAQLAAAAENKGQLWEHDGARDALVGSAATDEPEEVRLQALGALGDLAIANVNGMRIWQHDDARSVMLGGAAADQSGDVRVAALEALRKVTCMHCNAPPGLTQPCTCCFHNFNPLEHNAYCAPHTPGASKLSVHSIPRLATRRPSDPL